MSEIPSVSNFSTDGSLDTENTLSTGGSSSSTVLISDLVEGETRIAIVDDASSANRKGGFMLIEEEMIYYGLADSSSPNHVYDLIRAQLNTVDVLHSAGAPVTLFSTPRFDNPARTNAIISMQEVINDLKERVEVLETP